MSDLVGNSGDRFSRDAAHFLGCNKVHCIFKTDRLYHHWHQTNDNCNTLYSEKKQLNDIRIIAILFPLIQYFKKEIIIESDRIINMLLEFWGILSTFKKTSSCFSFLKKSTCLIEGSNMIFHSLTFARSREKC